MKEVVQEQVLPPDKPTPDEASRLLLRSGGKYDTTCGSDSASLLATGALASFGSGELSLPADVRSAPRLVGTLGGEDAQLFKGFRERLLLDSDEYAARVNAEGVSGLYFDPVLKRNRKQYLGLIMRIHHRRLLPRRSSVEEQVGIFFVTKKT